MKRLVFGAAAAALLVAGQPGQAANANAHRATANDKAIAAVKKIMAEKLKYPATARFTDLRAYPIKGGHLIIVCGGVGGSNEAGRSVGYVQFIANVVDGQADPDEAELYDPTLLEDYSVPQRCEMAARRQRAVLSAPALISSPKAAAFGGGGTAEWRWRGLH